MQKLMEDNGITAQEKMKIDDKIVFKGATSNDKLFREPAEEEKPLPAVSAYVSDLLSTSFKILSQEKL